MGRGLVISLPALDEGQPLVGETAVKAINIAANRLSRVWAWVQERKATHASSKRMRIIETVSFGEKRFISVVQVDKQQFLFGGGPSTVALLAQLSAPESFGEVLQEAKAPHPKRLARKSKARSGEAA